MAEIFNGIAGTGPIILFLAVMIGLDSFTLVPFRRILFVLFLGGFSALCCYCINSFFLNNFSIAFDSYAVAAAPWIEEAVKISFFIVLLHFRKTGFLVDSAIIGFAVGAGFGFVENIVILTARPDAGITLWMLRGFGTGIMHGSTVAIAGIIGQYWKEKSKSDRLVHYLPGFLFSVLIHFLYNYFRTSPVAVTVSMIAVMPVLMAAVFSFSERSMRLWLESGFANDAELYKLILSGKLTATPMGEYLKKLREHFSAEITADIFCYLRLFTELSIRAKATLLMQEAGFTPAPDPAIKPKIDELNYLKKSIGRAGIITLQPLLHFSPRELWQIDLMSKSGK